MKTRPINLYFLMIGLGLMLSHRGPAQTLSVLHHFNGSDEGNPYAGLILSGSTLYGTADFGGSAGRGVVFAVSTNGAGYTNLYGFTATSGVPPYTNSDGANPRAGLILSGDSLFGAAFRGGSAGNGTIFRVNTNGLALTNLHSFTGTPEFTNHDGANPYAGLVLADQTLYGTTFLGGRAGAGVVFRLNVDGSGFTNLHDFTGGSDGSNLYAGLVLSGGTLYGAAHSGGSSNCGTVFAVNTDGTGFTILHDFGYGDGANPYGGLTLSGGTLYGTTANGGGFNRGTVFRVETNGASFTNLHIFAGEDGNTPYGSLLLSGNTLYGTTYGGGIPGSGVVFNLNTLGTEFTNLYSFTGGSDEANPQSGLLRSGDTFYGTAFFGGGVGAGTVFSLSLTGAGSATLFLTQASDQMVLTWVNTNFNLQSALAVTGIYATIPDATSPYTNPAASAQQFFRLIAE